MTRPERGGVLVGAAGAGMLLALRARRRRHGYDFGSKSVLITGGSRGLGLVLARELAGEGARLTLLARDVKELARAVGDIRRGRPEAEVLAVVADVRRRDDMERAIRETVARYGRIDVVINNAGVIQAGPSDHMEVADYEDAMNTHFWGPLHLILATLPHMRRQGGGRIVNIASIGGRISVPHLLPYSASKFALVGLSEGLRAELARHNIAVTTVCPGLMRTGSPVNATFKGKRWAEYAWFAILDSLPLTSIDARRAARQIVDACRRGDAELVITPQAKIAILARTLAPETFAAAMALVNRLLPGPTVDGVVAKRGRDSESAWAPSIVTASTYRAAAVNNEL